MTNKGFLYIVIATFATIMIWVVVDIIHSQAQIQIAPEVKELLEPIDPNFDTEIINAL